MKNRDMEKVESGRLARERRNARGISSVCTDCGETVTDSQTFIASYGDAIDQYKTTGIKHFYEGECAHV